MEAALPVEPALRRGLAGIPVLYHRKDGFSMTKNEFTFPSRDGKTALHAVEWLPADIGLIEKLRVVM